MADAALAVAEAKCAQLERSSRITGCRAFRRALHKWTGSILAAVVIEWRTRMWIEREQAFKGKLKVRQGCSALASSALSLLCVGGGRVCLLVMHLRC